jgi:membrane glycosyltransferase
LRRAGLLLIPEERRPPPVISRANYLANEFTSRDTNALAGLYALYADSEFRAFHEACLPRRRKRNRGDIPPDWALASAKLSGAQTIDEATVWLKPRERMAIMLDPGLIARLALLPKEPPRHDVAVSAG